MHYFTFSFSILKISQIEKRRRQQFVHKTFIFIILFAHKLTKKKTKKY